MPLVRTEQIINLTEYVDKLSTFSGARWYRGVGKESHELQPGLYRHPSVKDTTKLIQNEAQAIDMFSQRSILYLDHAASSAMFDSKLSMLFLMQHHGAPTRLLDWTENPFVALFFALIYAEYDKDEEAGLPKYSSDPAVWILDPKNWNSVSADIDPPPGIASPFDDLVHGYIRPAKEGPIALLGIHNSRRIIAQSGVFVLFGTDSSPMEVIYTKKKFPADTLVKIVVPKERVAGLLDELMAKGIGDATVYPDLGGLSAQLKRKAGYWMP